MRRIEKYLDIIFEKHKKNWDTLICICGNVGVGKSNLALHMLEYWNTKLYGKVTAKDIKHMCLTKEDFVRDLSDCKKNEMTIFDEAGELSSRKAMTQYNRDLTIAYQIIRADTLFTILVIPDIKYLDTYFRNTRIKHLFYVYQRGRVGVFLKRKLRKLMSYNQNNYNYNYQIIRPDFYDTYPIYKGVMSEEYDKLKQKKTREARKKLKDMLKGNTREITTIDDVPEHLYKKIAYRYLKEKHDKETALQFVDIAERTSFRYDKEMKTDK